MFGDSTLFEGQMKDFQEIENDPNKNVDGQDEVKKDTKSDLLDIANTQLGWAVADQLKKILENPNKYGIDDADLNPNAVKMIYKFVYRRDDEDSQAVRVAIEDWVEEGWGDPDVLGGLEPRESKTNKEEVKEEENKVDTVSNDPSFERTVDEFAQIENDTNKNVDERDEELLEAKDFTDKFTTAYSAEIESGEERDDAIRNALDIASEGAFSRSDEGAQKRWFEKFSKFIEDSIEPETNEREEVKEEGEFREDPGLEDSIPSEEVDMGKVARHEAEDDLVAHIKEWTGEDVNDESIRRVIWAFASDPGLVDKVSVIAAQSKPVESKEEVKEEVVVDEQLLPHSDDILFISKTLVGEDAWSILKTREGSNTATAIFTFVSEEAAVASGSKIADVIGGEYRGKEDPRESESRQRTEAKVDEQEVREDLSVADVKGLFKSIDPLFAKHLTGMTRSKKDIIKMGQEVGLELSAEGKKIKEE